MCDPFAMPTDLLDLVARYRVPLVRGTAITAFLLIATIGIVSASQPGEHPMLAVGFILFLYPIYLIQHWLFVRRGRDPHGSRPATVWNLSLPTLIFTLQGCLSAYFAFVTLLHLNASPELMTQVQGKWSWAYAGVPALLIATAVASGVSASRGRALRRLARAQLLISWTSAVMIFSAFLGMAQAAPYYLQRFGTSSDLMPAALCMLLLHPCFALGVFASLHDVSPIGSEEPVVSNPQRDEAELPTDGYVSSARTLAFVLIVFTLLSFDVARSNAARVSLLREARDMFARQIARDLLAQGPLVTISEMPRVADWVLAGAPIDFPTYGEAVVRTRVSAQPEIPGKTGPDALYSVQGGFQVEFAVDGGRQWRSIYEEPREEVRGDDDPRNRVVFDDALPQDFARILRHVGLPVDELLEQESGYSIDLQAFAMVEESLLRQPVSIPSIGLGVESNEAIWILSGSVLILLVLLRSRVDACLDRVSSGIAQPWLILDARSGLESVAAGCWMFAIGLSAWIANGSLIALVVSEKYAQGVSKTLPTMVVTTTAVLALIGVGGWLSLSTASRLLRLRRLRCDQTVGATDAD
jgi:hypothetical protein